MTKEKQGIAWEFFSRGASIYYATTRSSQAVPYDDLHFEVTKSRD